MHGGIILTLFASLLGVHLLWPSGLLALIGIPVAIATGTYTAFLFAQAKARDLWQSPLLPPQHLVQCIVAGAASLLLAGRLDLVPLLAIATAIHLILIAAEVVTPHVTAHARLAVHEMVRGQFRLPFALGVILQALGIALIGWPPIAAALILIGLFAFEHAHIRAGQAVPLA